MVRRRGEWAGAVTFRRPARYREGMPQFAQPWFLLLLPLAPLAAWAWRRTPRPALRWPDLRSFDDLPMGRAPWAQVGGAILRGVAVAALILALAGPRWPDPGTRMPADGVAIAIALDVSGSMAETDFDWDGQPIDRLTAAQRALRGFVLADGQRGQDAVALIAFAAQPDDTAPLTLSHDALVRLLDAEKPRSLPETGTNIGDAVVWALKALEASDVRRKLIVLVSDGEHNAPGPALTPRQAAQLAAARGVPIYSIDAGPTVDSHDRSESAAARRTGRQTLTAVAEMTGGKSFAAHDVNALREAVAEIDRLERAPIVSFQYRRYAEGFPACAMIALGCLAFALALESTVWRRTP